LACKREQFGQDFRALVFMARYAKSLAAISPLSDRQKDMQRRDGPMILGHRPTVATAKMHLGRRLLQRHDGGGENQTDRHVVKFR
jgi:hypothetical protein